MITNITVRYAALFINLKNLYIYKKSRLFLITINK